jgi:hypothetical protein
MGIHLLRCAHGNKHTETHDTICNTFIAIMRDVSFHMEQKQLRSIPHVDELTLCSPKMAFAP